MLVTDSCRGHSGRGKGGADLGSFPRPLSRPGPPGRGQRVTRRSARPQPPSLPRTAVQVSVPMSPVRSVSQAVNLSSDLAARLPPGGSPPGLPTCEAEWPPSAGLSCHPTHCHFPQHLRLASHSPGPDVQPKRPPDPKSSRGWALHRVSGPPSRQARGSRL